MTTGRDAAFLCLGLFWAIAGCQPDIGDPCQVPSDCSLRGDRLCDTTQPGGYCTKFNCEPGGCPKEAVCVAYNSVLSGVGACADRQGGRRLLRTFCLKSCKSHGDCRSQYECIDIAPGNPWQAEVVEFGNVNTRVCALPFDGEMIPDDRPGDICISGADASFPPPAPPPAEDASARVDARADAAAMSEDAATDAADASFATDASFAGDARADVTVMSLDAATDVSDASRDVSRE